MRYLMFCAAIALPIPVLAQPAPEAFTPTAPGAIHYPAPIKPGEEIKTVKASVSELRGLAGAGQWGPFASGVIALVLLIFATLLTRFESFRKLVKPHQGELAIIVPALVCLVKEFAGIAPGAGFGEWLNALAAGAYVGAASVGFYEVMWKRWLKPVLLRLWKFVKARLDKKDSQ